MAASALLARSPQPTDREIDSALRGNICRCGMYGRIRTAIKSVDVANTDEELFYNVAEVDHV
jgi:aerobic-type carbon monoxide dehydrogenase small subunit (CoxS/CutS family)